MLDMVGKSNMSIDGNHAVGKDAAMASRILTADMEVRPASIKGVSMSNYEHPLAVTMEPMIWQILVASACGCSNAHLRHRSAFQPAFCMLLELRSLASFSFNSDTA
jgi:hypothetical protein